MKNKTVDELLGKEIFDFEKFHSKTKLKKLTRNVNEKFWPKEWKTYYYKGYLRMDEVKMPKPHLARKITLLDTLSSRKSTRAFSQKPTTLQEISNLLKFSAGLSANPSPFVPRRYYPSGGGRFPLETYILSINSDLPEGVYHYYIKNHTLERLGEFKKKDISAITSLPWAKDTSFLIVITAIFKRNVIKYGERGYRHVLVEAGHLAQNFYLLSGVLGLGICGIGGYIDDNINNFLDVDGREESVIYVLGVGKPKETVR